MALRFRKQVHRSLSFHQRNLVIRLRLRRERSSRQEVLCTSHSVDNGAGRRLACRTHVDCWSHATRRRNQIRRGRLSFSLRQNKHGNDDSVTSRMESRNDRRRHCLDEIWARWSVVRHQSRSRLLRSSTRNGSGNQPQCFGDPLWQLRIYQRRRNRRW